MWRAGPKRFLEREVEDWHVECWSWLVRNLGGLSDLRARPLVLPNAKFFPAVKEEGHARALAVFRRVKSIMGMDEWPCALTPQHDTGAQLSEFVVLKPRKAAAGTFRLSQGEAVITYDPKLLSRPVNFIATLAHELAHYRLRTIEEPPPGARSEPMLEELATELAVAYHGFAVISANGAFEFSQHQDFGSQGWRSSTSGYFSEDGWVFALAVFLALREEPSNQARASLKPHLAKKLAKAEARLVADPEFLAALRTNVGAASF